MKTYHLSYTHLTGCQRHLKTTDINYFSQLLDRAIDDEYVLTGSITIYTEGE